MKTKSVAVVSHPIQSPPSLGSACLRVVQRLDYTNIAIIILLGIATAVVQHLKPVQRPIFLYDATIAYTHTEHELPFWVALVVPFLVLVATAVAVECWLVKQERQRAAAAITNIILSVFAAVAVVAFITELFKRICGRLRPDFLHRCQPDTTSSMQIPFGTYPNTDCKDTDILQDGHMSFPSGHSSCSMAFGMFSAMYLLWSLYYRDSGELSKGLMTPGQHWFARVWKDIVSLAAVLLVLFDIAWPWGVAVSRFRDNRHNVSDVVGGLLLAACFVPVFIIRLVQHCSFWWGHDEQELKDQEVLPIADGLDVAEIGDAEDIV